MGFRKWVKKKYKKGKKAVEKGVDEVKKGGEKVFNKGKQAKRKVEYDTRKTWSKQKRKTQDDFNKAWKQGHKEVNELKKKGKDAIDSVEERAKRTMREIERGTRDVFDGMDDVLQYLHMNADDFAKKVADKLKGTVDDVVKKELPKATKEIKEEVVDEVKEVVVKEIPDLFGKQVPNIANTVIDVMKENALEKIVEEIEHFGETGLMNMAKVGVEQSLEINALNPMDSFSVSASVAGNGLQLDWDGQEQAEETLTTVHKSLKDNRISVEEIGNIAYTFIPTSITLTQGGTIIIAVILGSGVDISLAQTYKRDKVKKFMQNIKPTATKVFYETPKLMLEAGLKGNK